jgi:gluconokinase
MDRGMKVNDLNSLPLILVMGVSASGKTTIGKMLADRLNGSFIDADTYHPKSNIEKMMMGEPLNDVDRWPWLDKIVDITQGFTAARPLVLACSALKKSYRQRLKLGNAPIVFLTGSREVIERRLVSRSDHFMPIQLLDSQLEFLEEPTEAIVISISNTPKDIIDMVVHALKKTL